jgi:hypothetical protein
MIADALHRIFQDFIDRLSSAPDREAHRDTMAMAAAALDLSCFVYLSIPPRTRTARLEYELAIDDHARR